MEHSENRRPARIAPYVVEALQAEPDRKKFKFDGFTVIRRGDRIGFIENRPFPSPGGWGMVIGGGAITLGLVYLLF